MLSIPLTLDNVHWWRCLLTEQRRTFRAQGHRRTGTRNNLWWRSLWSQIDRRAVPYYWDPQRHGGPLQGLHRVPLVCGDPRQRRETQQECNNILSSPGDREHRRTEPHGHPLQWTICFGVEWSSQLLFLCRAQGTVMKTAPRIRDNLLMAMDLTILVVSFELPLLSLHQKGFNTQLWCGAFRNC